MKNVFAVLLIFSGICCLGGGLDRELNRVERWQDNASGVTKRTFDASEKAMRFDFTFRGNVDRWAYPTFKAASGESLENMNVIEFEIKLVQPETSNRWKAAFLMLTPKGRVALPAPTGLWQTVRINLRDPSLKLNLKGVNGLRIGANPTADRFTMWLRNIRAAGTAAAPLDAAAEIRCEAPGTVFLDSEPLEFQFSRIGEYAPLRYEIQDFYGKTVKQGTWPENGTLKAGKLPPGYYMISLNSGKGKIQGRRSFTVVRDPKGHTPNPESPFALDTALSWLGRADKNNVRFPHEGFDLLIEILRRSGVGSIRERLLWKEVQPSKDAEINWKHYKRNADKLKSYGINILGLTHDSPAWAQYKEERGNLPDNLLDLYRFTKALASDFKGRMSAWEFWNEPDHPAHHETPWDLAAAQKAASLGFRAGDPELALLQGSFCMFPLGNYVSIYMKNGTKDYFDVFNYHAYRALSRYPEITAEIRDFLRKNGMEEIPVYLTEAGTNAEGDSAAKSSRRGQAETTEAQDRLLAEFIVKSPILFLANGVMRSYFFVFPPYHERNGAKDWGMLRRDYSAKPQVAAFSTLLWELDRAEYLGEYDLGAGRRAFLFQQPDGSQTLVAWLESILDREKHDAAVTDASVADTTFSLPVGGDLECVDIMGKTTVHPSSALPLSRYPGYIRGISGLKASKAPVPVGHLKKRVLSAEHAIVFKPVFLSGFETSSDRSCMLYDKGKGQIRLEVFNLSGQMQKGKVKVSGLSGLSGLPEQMELPPMSRNEFILEGTPDRAVTELAVNGVFNGRKVTPAVVPLRSLAALNTASRQPLENSANRWRSNSSGRMEITDDPDENAVCFRTRFTSGDFWTYPEYVLRLPEETFKGAAAIRFEIRGDGRIGQSNLMLVEGTQKEVGRTTMLGIGPVSSGWRTVTMLLPVQDTDVKMFRIGVNPKEKDYRFWIRNIELLRIP